LPLVDGAILDATIDLLIEGGLDAATTERIAARSRVAKTTIYRRWPSRDALLLDAFRQTVEESLSRFVDAPTGSDLTGSVHGVARQALDVLGGSVFIAVLPIIARHTLTGTELGAWLREHALQTLRAAARDRLADATRRDAPVGVDADFDSIVDLTYGGVLFRALAVGTVDSASLRSMSDLLIAGAAPRSALP
jgi:AcrR family transcriptional regulator